jgi:hypothetical protein
MKVHGLLLSFGIGLSVACGALVAAETTDMTATIYDDGIACPGACDAHVVFAPVHNGTRNAFAPPMSNRDNPAKCTAGQQCIICFNSADGSCIAATYRGAGPPAGRFDFTPAFFSENCSKPDLPEPLAQQCRTMRAQVDRYRSRLNCFDHGDAEPCRSLLAEAERAKRADAIERNACLAEGEARYNARQTDPSCQRSLGCNYERHGTGRNSSGQTWRKLLPAACRDGTYVGPFGTDCCYGDLYAAASFNPECRAFFPDQ